MLDTGGDGRLSAAELVQGVSQLSGTGKAQVGGGLGFRVQGFRVSGFRVSGLQGFRVSGLQCFRVSGF